MNPPLVLSVSPTFASMGSEPVELIEGGGAVYRRWSGGAGVGASAWMDELAEASALVVGTQLVDRTVIERAPLLTVIAKHGVGVDNIDIGAATAAGIAVTNTPGVNSVAVAELTMGLLIACARGIVQADRAVRQGDWGPRVGRSLVGSTLGIIGLGAIGQLVAARAAPFGLAILGFDVMANGSRRDTPWRAVSLDRLLRESDFVTLHVPLTPSTTNLIGAEALGAMKPGACLINTARGGIVDETALAQALSSGHIGRAALDVFSNEPPDAAAFDPERTILTPHMAGYSDASVAATSLAVATSIDEALRGTLPMNAVNAPVDWRGGHPGYSR